MPGDHQLDKQHPLAHPGGRAHVAKDAHRVVVGPVVDHVLEDVGVATFGHEIEERPLGDPHPVFDTVLGQQRRGPRHHLGPVEQDAARVGRRGQDRGQQAALPAAHVDDGGSGAQDLDVPKVIAGDDRRDREFRSACHGLVEDFTEFGLVRQVVEGRFAAQRGDNGPAGADRFAEVAPMLPVLGRSHPPRPARHRYVGVATKSVSQRGEVVAALTTPTENAAGYQRPQQATDRVGVGVDRGRQLVGRNTPLGPLASASAMPRSAAAVIACAAHISTTISINTTGAGAMLRRSRASWCLTSSIARATLAGGAGPAGPLGLVGLSRGLVGLSRWRRGLARADRRR